MLDQTPVQIAWVTNDLTATETTLSALLGVPRWFRMPGVHFAPDTCTYRGEPADCVADISLSYAGDMQLEVIAPTSGVITVDGRNIADTDAVKLRRGIGYVIQSAGLLPHRTY